MSINPEEFQLIQALLLKMSGISLAANKTYLVDSRLSHLLPQHNCTSFLALFQKAKKASGSALLGEIIDLMTTNETLWFRDQHPFTIFKEKLLPAYLQEIKNGTRKKISIWSSACSTGQEPYSLAMIIISTMRQNPWFKPEMINVLATDLSETCLKTARNGEYNKIAIERGLPEEYRRSYFENSGRLWHVVDQVKEMVQFKKFNLQDSFATLAKFDIILCRNVAIYFSKEFKRDLFSKFATILAADGYFFMGASESLTGYSTQFDIHQHGPGYYYKLCNN